MKDKIFLLASGINKLEGGTYNIDSILKAIKTVTDWTLQVKQRIIQTMFGIVGIILAISLVNLIISLF